MSNNRLKLLVRMVEDAGLTADELPSMNGSHIIVMARVPGFSETRRFCITMRDGDPRGDQNERARMKRFYREMVPEPHKTVMEEKLKAVLPEFKNVPNVAPPTEVWDEAVLGPMLRSAEPQATIEKHTIVPPRVIRPLVPIARGKPEGYEHERVMPLRLTTRQQALLHRMLRWFEEQENARMQTR